MSSPQPSSSTEATTPSAGQKRRQSSENPEQAPEAKHSKGLFMEDFPANLPNPFAEEFCGSDLVLIVEGKKLHTHRVFISLYCSYFRVMLGSKDFAETKEKEIELKGDQFVNINYDTMVTFLQFLYPVKSVENIRDDELLKEMFYLSEYFQCQHVRAKCEAYLQQKMDLLGTGSTDSTQMYAQSACLYLWLCEKYGIKKFVEQLLDVSCRKQQSEIEGNKHFKSLSPELQRDEYLKRVRFLEKKLVYQSSVLNHGIFRTPIACDVACTKCGDTRTRKCIACRDCRDEYMNGFSHYDFN